MTSRDRLLILAGVLLGLFLAALDQTIVATALPAIVADLHGLDLLAWVSTGYLLASTAMVPIYGRLADLHGRRRILVAGIVIFLGGSALCGVAQSMLQLIAFRVLQGAGAAALTSTAFIIPADLFAPAERPRYQGLFGAVFALASLVGPALGGVLTDTVGWRWVFYVNVPVGALALAVVLLRMPAMARGIRAPIDWPGTVLLLAAVVPLLLALTLDRTLYPWDAPLTLALLATSGLAAAAFLVVERRAPSPILPLGLFRNRTVALIAAASLLTGAAFFGALFFLSLFMVNVVGVSSTAAGSTLVPLTLAVVTGALLSAQVVQRTGRYKEVIVAGYLVATVGMGLLATMGEHVTQGGVVWRMVVLGLGLGPSMPLLTLVVQNAAPPGQVGTATASRQFFMQIGSVVGVAVFGAIFSATLTRTVEAALRPALAQLPPRGVQRSVDPTALRASLRGLNGGGGLPVTVSGPAGTAVRTAVRHGFAVSILRIYASAIPLTLAASALMLALPEIPLRRTRPPAPGAEVAAGQGGATGAWNG